MKPEPGSCSICGGSLGELGGWEVDYPGLVCRACDNRALDERGRRWIEAAPFIPAKPGTVPGYDIEIPNPVYVDGIRCWRRYRFGGFLTTRDPADSKTLEEFYENSGMFRRRDRE